MEFKKTIAAVAITVSSISTFARMPGPKETKNICLDVRQDAKGALYAGNCDQTRNNQTSGVELLANGCAQEQIALRASKYGEKFDIEVRSCLPPHIVQL
jgi:hypothetical protein